MIEMKEKNIYDLWLDSLWECAPRKKHLLIEKYGDSYHVWKEGNNDVLEGMKSGAQENDRIRTLEEAEAISARLKEMDVTALAWDDEEFPDCIRSIKNPPWMIYVYGKQELLYRTCVAVVGARKASDYGKLTAQRIGERLAHTEAVVVSGMASGIDAWAHQGTLEEGGDTIAVLAGGVDVCYPKSNRRLYGEIRRKGAIISEFRPGIRPRAYYFPLRNRLISGISAATVIVEAAVGSGSLITAELAMEQGREVFAVPGNIDRIGSLGTNKLIKDGAGILISVEDLVEELSLEDTNDGLEAGMADGAAEPEALGDDEKAIIRFLLCNGEATTDQLMGVTGFSTSKINGLVTVLEMKGIVSTAIGKIFLAKKFENLYNMPLMH
ncbi:MAG: DNA-processing protein DprA [Firmicutes bacterium]|nr:DNA-processing protein DprA [Bacillota bacterium]